MEPYQNPVEFMRICAFASLVGVFLGSWWNTANPRPWREMISKGCILEWLLVPSMFSAMLSFLAYGFLPN